jgi:uncharacterized membrane protein required for colicin V production
MVDILILVILVAGFALGYIRGVIRQLLLLAAFVVSFLVAAHLIRLVSPWLVEQQRQFSVQYTDMLAFALVFTVLFGGAAVVIEAAGTVSDLTQHARLDDVLGGLLGLGITFLVLGTVIVMLNIFYGLSAPAPSGEIIELRRIHSALGESAIAEWMRHSLLPGLNVVLGPLLPTEVRTAMG